MDNITILYLPYKELELSQSPFEFLFYQISLVSSSYIAILHLQLDLDIAAKY